MRLFLVLVLLGFGMAAFSQLDTLYVGNAIVGKRAVHFYNAKDASIGQSIFDCPKDTTERFYDREQQVLYVYELKYVTSKGDCVAARSFYVVMPSGKRIFISKDVWEKVTGKVVKANNN